MQNYWSKEDLANFNDSEVFKELEARIIDTVKRAGILTEKIAAQEAVESLKAIEDQAKKTTEALSNLAEDPEEDKEEDEADDATLEVVAELRILAQEAISKNDIKLAYKIERTIDEILEQEVVCE
jgi:hypothetical protein